MVEENEGFPSALSQTGDFSWNATENSSGTGRQCLGWPGPRPTSEGSESLLCQISGGHRGTRQKRQEHKTG